MELDFATLNEYEEGIDPVWRDARELCNEYLEGVYNRRTVEVDRETSRINDCHCELANDGIKSGIANCLNGDEVAGLEAVLDSRLNDGGTEGRGGVAGNRRLVVAESRVSRAIDRSRDGGLEDNRDFEVEGVDYIDSVVVVSVGGRVLAI